MNVTARHYLQSNSWMHLRSTYHNQPGFDESVSSGGLLRLVGHISRERRRRSIYHNYFLEAFYGPYTDSDGQEIHISKETIHRIMDIARKFKVRKIRLHGYSDKEFGYVTLAEFARVLIESKMQFVEHESSTLIYNLDEHVFDSLDSCSVGVRKNLRKASEIRIVLVNHPDQVKEFFIQLALLKGRNRPRAREITAYQNWQEGYKLFLAYDATLSRCVGTLGFVFDNYMATEIASSTAKGIEARGVQEKLHLACFDQAKKMGMKNFDLAGLEKMEDGSWNSIARFKLKFGGSIVNTGFIEINF